ncbi:MAG: large conductance mechanosensitive channel protein MscL [Candidatus Izemoplasmatales bacterium]
MGKFFKEFREFISKGNALDLAVGLVIGTAFNAIIKSLVADIITPLISLLFKADLSNMAWVLRGTREWDSVNSTYVLSENAVLLTYGNFFQAIIDFIIIALAIFLALKVITRLSSRLQKVKDAIAPNNKEIKE